MSATIEIANQAYAHLGKGTFIASLDEDSAEAKLAKLFEKPSLKATLREFHWPFAGKIATAKLVEEDPNSEWAYSYRYPKDCIDLRRVLSGLRNERPDQAVPYRIMGDEGGLLILTDQPEAEIEYTWNVSTAGLFPPDFELAWGLRWAVYMAPKIMGADPTKQGERLMAKYLQHIGMAKVNAAMEERRDPDPTNSFVAARG